MEQLKQTTKKKMDPPVIEDFNKAGFGTLTKKEEEEINIAFSSSFDDIFLTSN